MNKWWKLLVATNFLWVLWVAKSLLWSSFVGSDEHLSVSDMRHQEQELHMKQILAEAAKKSQSSGRRRAPLRTTTTPELVDGVGPQVFAKITAPTKRDRAVAALAAAAGDSAAIASVASGTSFDLVVPGHGEAHRTAPMIEAIKSIRKNMPSSIRFQCEIYVYSVRPNKQRLKDSGCYTFFRRGLWTNFMKQVYVGSTYVAIMMDDVTPVSLDIQTFLSSMKRHNLGMLSASIATKWNWKVMNQNESCLLRKVGYSDILFSVFTREAFLCWQNIIDLTINPSGWGYDVAFPKLCKVEIGVSDQHMILHSTGNPGEKNKERSYDDQTAKTMLWRWLRHSLHWKIPDDESGYRQLTQNNNAPQKECVPRSGLVLADPEYLQQVSHRGGWRTVMQHVVSEEVVTLNQRGSQIYFVDCCESYFLWNNRVMKKPWVGMLHYTPDLPPTFPEFETLQGVLAAEAFKQSLPWCRALIVFSNRNAEFLSAALPGVKVVVMKHPTGVTGKPQMFDLEKFKSRSAGWKLTMVGQQYRRLATLLKVRTKYPKVWLPGDRKLDKHSFAQRLKRDVNAPANPDLNSFEIAYTLDFSQYDDFVLNNIIILDVFDAAANNAVMEAIVMANPIFVRRHRSIMEYLGPQYPLFFDELADLERMIATESSVIQNMRAGHEYLKDLPTKKELTLEWFSSSLAGISRKLEETVARDLRKERACAQWQRGPKSCGSLLSGFSALAAGGCKQDSVDCEVTEPKLCAAMCRQHPKCKSFIMTVARPGCELCSAGSRSTVFLPGKSYHPMSCWDNNRGAV